MNCHKCSIGFKSGDWAGESNIEMPWSSSHTLTHKEKGRRQHVSPAKGYCVVWQKKAYLTGFMAGCIIMLVDSWSGKWFQLEKRMHMFLEIVKVFNSIQSCVLFSNKAERDRSLTRHAPPYHHRYSSSFGTRYMSRKQQLLNSFPPNCSRWGNFNFRLIGEKHFPAVFYAPVFVFQAESKPLGFVSIRKNWFSPGNSVAKPKFLQLPAETC